jgi:hypothetical protein
MSVVSIAPPDARAGVRVLDAIARSAAVACLVAIILAVFQLFHGADTPFLAFSVIGAVAVQAVHKPRVKEVVFTLALAACVGVAYARNHGRFGEYFGAGVIAAAAFLGLAGMIVLGWKACRATEELAPLLTATFCPLLMIFTNLGLAMAIQFSPKVFDLYLYRFDSLLGFQLSFLIGQWFIRVPFLYTVCFLVYASLPLAEVLVVVLFLRGYRMPANPLMVCIAAGIAGFLLYQVCPAAGPVHVFHSVFPQAPPSIPSLQAIALADVPRNAMPSLHTAWALLMWWNLRHCPRWMRYAATAFLTFTLLATLGLGEHYLVDLVAAVPFAAAVQTACTKQWLRSSTLVGITIGWVVYLRFGLPGLEPTSQQAWAGITATVAASATLALWRPWRESRYVPPSVKPSRT